MTKSKRNWHEILGYNYRMTNLQAAIGSAQMKKIENILKKKKEIAAEYKKNLMSVQGIIFPTENIIYENVFCLFTIIIDKDFFGINSYQLMKVLNEHKIDTRPIFPPLHTQPIYNNKQRLPVAEKIHAGGITLPSAYDLQFNEIKQICKIIIDCGK